MPEVLPILLAGAVASLLPRLLGAALSGRIDPDGAAFRWVGCVAYALLAGLIARMILLPAGPLQATDLAIRLIAAGLALAVFLSFGKGLLAGSATGVLALIALTLLGVRIF